MHNKEIQALYPSPDIITLEIIAGCDWRGMWQVWGRREIHTGFAWEKHE